MFKNIIFDVIYQVGQEFKREQVTEMTLDSIGVLTANGKDVRNGKAAVFQFLRLFDKVGVPIYEGHIVKDRVGQKYEVGADGGSPYLIKDEEAYPLTLANSMEYEVCGDIIRHQSVNKPIDEQEFIKKIENTNVTENHSDSK